MRRLLILTGLLLLPLLGGCASERYARPSTGEVQRGMASWYGEEFHGRPTASGETYDMYELSAAHRELPLGTMIEVKNLDNGRHVKLRVNDRGPFVRGRVLDLSYGAAKKLGMVEAGLAKVEIRVVEVGKGTPGPSRFTRYAVQLGAYREIENARAIEERLIRAKYPEVEIMSAGGWHRVRLGRVEDRDEAEAVLRRLRKDGFEAVVVPLS